MRTTQVFTAALALVLGGTVACDRTDVRRETREVSAEVREVAGRAGDRLADSWLTAKVQAQFFADDDIKSRFIDVETHDAMVTLSGFVETDDVRRQALAIARNTDGVRQVHDDLLIGQLPPDRQAAIPEPIETMPERGSVATGGDGTAMPAPAETPALDDEMVRSLIQAKYFLNPSLKSRHIDVQSVNGVVTLRGEVAGDNERAQALLLARTTEGVERVEDSLTINASLAPAPAPETPAVGTSGVHTEDMSLETAVRNGLADDAQLKAAAIEVSARDGVVLLQGTVPTQAAKQRALTAARRMDDVVQVVDRLTVK